MFNNIINSEYYLRESDYESDFQNYSPEYKEYYVRTTYYKLISNILLIFFGAECLFFISDMNMSVSILCYIVIVFLFTIAFITFQSFITKKIHCMNSYSNYIEYDFEYHLSLESWGIFHKLYIYIFGSVSFYSIIINNMYEWNSFYIVIITIMTYIINYYFHMLKYNLHYMNSYSEINIEEIRKIHLLLEFYNTIFTLLLYVLGIIIIFSISKKI